MLSKLIKYDLKYFYKWLTGLYLATLIFAITAALTANFPDIFILNAIHEFSAAATFGLVFGTIINICMRIWMKYDYSVYRDEAYLTHTLPISRRTIWAAKFLTSLIVVAISIIVSLSCFALVFFTIPDNNFDALFAHSEVWPLLIAAICTIFLQINFVIQCGLLSINLSHRFDSYRTALAIVFGFLIYFFCEGILAAAILLWAQFDQNISAFLADGPIETNLSYLTTLFNGISILYVVFIASGYLLNSQLLQRGVNVD